MTAIWDYSSRAQPYTSEFLSLGEENLSTTQPLRHHRKHRSGIGGKKDLLGSLPPRQLDANISWRTVSICLLSDQADLETSVNLPNCFGSGAFPLGMNRFHKRARFG